MSGTQVIGFGCRLNAAESAAMQAIASARDDLVIVNSCAVTAEAVRDARRAIRRAHRTRPDARILVTGCAAQIDPVSFAAMPEVARVLGNAEKLLPAVLLDDAGPRVAVGDVARLRDMPRLAVSASGGTRAFVEVQSGCDHRCTFCIIPQGRGGSRSVVAAIVVERIAALVDGGVREVVLTGVDLTAWGQDLSGGESLGALVEAILRGVPALPRLRFSSLDPVEIDDRLLALIAGEGRVMPHLHLSLQAGDDMVLKRMRRRHGRAQAVAIVARLKAARRDVAIGADLIAGFPTEDDAMAANTLALIDDCDIVHGHVFPYSPRAGTPAARMPQVAPAVARARAARLREGVARRRMAWLARMVGTAQQVLVERGGKGHTETFAPVRIDATPGAIVRLQVTGVADDILEAVAA